MLGAIREFFDSHVIGPPPEGGAPKYNPVHVATAALLVEMMRMSGQTTPVERDRVLRTLETKFSLRPDETAPLVQLAEEQARQATDYYRFTSLIKNRLTPEEKERLIEHLWDVAYADGTLHPYEEHLVRKIADLLYVPHKTFIAAKLRARDR